MFRKTLIRKPKRDIITIDYAHNYSSPQKNTPWSVIFTFMKWLLVAGMFTLSVLYVNKVQATNINEYSTLDNIASGQLLFESTERLKTNKSEKKLYQPAMLVNSSADFNINGIIATVTLTQSFINNGRTVVNGLYTFPLPENSAVNFLKIQIGNRTIEGKIIEKNTAKKLFQQAKQQGKKASLVEQHRPNLFTNKIANIGAKEQITVTLKYVQHVAYDKGIFNLRFPMTITPRYSPVNKKNHPNEILNTDNTNNEEQKVVQQDQNNNHKTSYLSQLGSKHKNNIQLTINLNAGVLLQSITSPSHILTTQQSPENTKHYEISVGHVNVPMDKDFILQWRPLAKITPQLSIVHQNLDGDMYALAMLIPPIINKENNTENVTFARDITFIIDTSGSMQGSSIKQAKQSLRFALNTLTSKDSFNIIAFESTTTNLFNSTMMATVNNLAQANAFISQLSADGGTEMYQPLSNALSMRQTHLQSIDAIKQILFITDGAVSNEQALFKLISNTSELPRLFTVGIGSAPNGYFMRKAAQFGQGSYTYISNVNEVEEKMSTLLSKISRPALKNIQVKFHPLHVGSLEQYPNKVPDLYVDEPLIIAFKTSITPTSIQLFGQLASQPWQEKLDLTLKNNISSSHNIKGMNIKTLNHTTKTNQNLGISSIWARAKIEDLLDSVITGKSINEVKPHIINTSIQHQVMSPYTSFLAVETEKIKPKNNTINRASLDDVTKEVNKSPQAKLQKMTSQSIVATPFPKTAVGWLESLLIGLLLLSLSLLVSYLLKRTTQYNNVLNEK